MNGQARQAMITSFNDEKDSFSKCFILSTKAGGLGINLIGASKVVLMDGSWNPTFDLQAIYRAWRYWLCQFNVGRIKLLLLTFNYFLS